MGSVPRINYHLAIFLVLIESSYLAKLGLAHFNDSKSRSNFHGVISRGNCVAPSYTID